MFMSHNFTNPPELETDVNTGTVAKHGTSTVPVPTTIKQTNTRP